MVECNHFLPHHPVMENTPPAPAHIPLPWFLQYRLLTDATGSHPEYRILAGADRSILIARLQGWDEDDEANGRLIVTACNSHQELLDALKNLLKDMEEYGIIDYYDKDRGGGVGGAVTDALNAIAKAQGN